MEKSVTHEKVSFHVIAQGWVQGVGFRARTANIAKELGIFGTVKNLEDGTVEIFLEGSRYSIDQFLKILKENFPSGDVAFISSEKPFKNIFKAFKIIY